MPKKEVQNRVIRNAEGSARVTDRAVNRLHQEWHTGEPTCITVIPKQATNHPNIPWASISMTTRSAVKKRIHCAIFVAKRG